MTSTSSRRLQFGEPTLEEKWRIVGAPANPTDTNILNGPNHSYDEENSFLTMEFSVSEMIIPGQSSATLYTEGCRDEGAELVDKSYLDFDSNSNDKNILIDVVGTRRDYSDYCASNACPIGKDEEAEFYIRTATIVHPFCIILQLIRSG